MSRLRACWVVHAPLGLVVVPRMWTSCLPITSSMQVEGVQDPRPRSAHRHGCHPP
jgi:hypothetical protein